ncbi:hypothetical protein VTN31DRAFT_5297 [Thermomyces dupontii]|uniref:uncharacterized protein n=1 Tax=Talaromyces thermophilus TaxID=28565 RepID=UPI003742C41D
MVTNPIGHSQQGCWPVEDLLDRLGMLQAKSSSEGALCVGDRGIYADALRVQTQELKRFTQIGHNRPPSALMAKFSNIKLSNYAPSGSGQCLPG